MHGAGTGWNGHCHRAAQDRRHAPQVGCQEGERALSNGVCSRAQDPRHLHLPALQAVNHFRQTQPEVFAPVDQEAAADNGMVLRVGFLARASGVRRTVNLESVLQVGRPRLWAVQAGPSAVMS